MTNDELPDGPAFPRHEYERRLKAVHAEMEQSGLDVLLVFGPENIFYLTGYDTIGYSSFLTAIVPIGQEPRLVVRELERDAMLTTTWMSGPPWTVPDGQDPVEETGRAVLDLVRTNARVAVDQSSWFLTVKSFEALVARLGGLSILDGSGIVERVRRVKSGYEIDLIRQAARHTERGVSAALATIRAGVRDTEVAAAAAAAMFQDGSDPLTIDPIVTVGKRSGIPHTTFCGRSVAPGDSVLLEMAAVKSHYVGALMRSAIVGQASPQLVAMYGACADALEAAIQYLRPGVVARDCHRVAQQVIDDAGFNANFRKRLGYSVGVGFAPDWGEGHLLDLSEGDKSVIEAGMVFHMPPALRQLGLGGVGCSETVLVTETGCEPLTTFSRDLVRVA